MIKYILIVLLISFCSGCVLEGLRQLEGGGYYDKTRNTTVKGK